MPCLLAGPQAIFKQWKFALLEKGFWRVQVCPLCPSVSSGGSGRPVCLVCLRSRMPTFKGFCQRFQSWAASASHPCSPFGSTPMASTVRYSEHSVMLSFTRSNKWTCSIFFGSACRAPWFFNDLVVFIQSIHAEWSQTWIDTALQGRAGLNGRANWYR